MMTRFLQYIDSYSFTKAQAEKFVISQSSPTFKTTCLRFRAIYGPKDVTVVEKVVVCRSHLKINHFHFAERRGGRMVHRENFLSRERSYFKYVCRRELWRSHGSCWQSSSGRHQKAWPGELDPVHRKIEFFEVYFIHDGNVIGQYSVWTPLIRALGRTPPSLSIPYQLVKHATSVVAWFCYEVIKRPPPMSPFELAILANDNTYSIEKAIKELGFSPNQNYFAKVDYPDEYKLWVFFNSGRGVLQKPKNATWSRVAAIPAKNRLVPQPIRGFGTRIALLLSFEFCYVYFQIRMKHSKF